MKSNHNIIVLETGHILKNRPASGDCWLEKISRYLPAQYRLTIILPKFATSHWQKPPIPVNYHFLPATPFDNHTNPLLICCNYFWRTIAGYNILKEFDSFNIVYSSTDIFPDIIPAWFFKLSHRQIQWIAQVHHLLPPPGKRQGNWLINTIALYWQKISLGCLKTHGDLVLVNNQLIYQQLVRMGFDKSKLAVVGAGINYQAIKQSKIIHGLPSYEAIFLGRLHQTKGVDDLVPIWKQVVKALPSAKLGVIGDGPSSILNKLHRQINDNQLVDNMTLIGHIENNSKLFSILKKSRLFLFTDHEAGWGLAAAEAMACGLPVIGFDIGVLGNVFTKGYLKVPAFNLRAFSRAIIYLLKNEKQRSKLSQEAIIQAKQLDWQVAANKFNHLLQQFC